MIKSAVPNETSMSELFTKLIRLAERLNENQPDIVYESYPFDQVLLMPELKEIKSLMNKYVFQRMLREIFKTAYLEYDSRRVICDQAADSRKWTC